MNRVAVAKELVGLAKEIIAIEFDTKKQLEEYRKEHRVRPTTRLVVKPQPKPKVKPQPKTKDKYEHKRDEWWDRPHSKERPLYHGTSKKNWEKIKKNGFIKPHVADDWEAGAAVWFTTDPEVAKEFSQKGGVIIKMKQGDAMAYKHLRYSPVPPVTMKLMRESNVSEDFIKDAIHHFDFIVRENIPLSKVEIVNFD